MNAQALIAEREQTVRLMAERIAAAFDPERIILFGSYARGDAGLDSDADFLVVMPVAGSRRQKATEIDAFISGMGLSKDVFVATPEDMRKYGSCVGTIPSIALRDGKVLYERPA